MIMTLMRIYRNSRKATFFQYITMESSIDTQDRQEATTLIKVLVDIRDVMHVTQITLDSHFLDLKLLSREFYANMMIDVSTI